MNKNSIRNIKLVFDRIKYNRKYSLISTPESYRLLNIIK